MIAAAGRASNVKLPDEPASANLFNEPNAACVVRACDGSDVIHQHRVLARNHERERPMLDEKTQMRDRDLRGFDGWDARTTKGAGFPKGSWLWRTPLVAPKA